MEENMIKTASYLKHAKINKKAYFHEKDDLLAGITFEDLITAVQTNEKIKSAETVKKVFREIVKANMKDAEAELRDNMQQILKEVKD